MSYRHEQRPALTWVKLLRANSYLMERDHLVKPLRVWTKISYLPASWNLEDTADRKTLEVGKQEAWE